MIGASARIENAVLTDQEIDWIDMVLSKDGKTTGFAANKTLIEDKFSKNRERSIEEVAECRAMLFLVYEQAKDLFTFSKATLRWLHHELMRYYGKAEPYIGGYKKLPNFVVENNHSTKDQCVVFKTADAGPITEAAMTNLILWYNKAIINEPWSLAVV